MDRELNPKEKNKSRYRRALQIALWLAVLAGLWLGLRSLLRQKAEADRFSMATVERGEVEYRLSASGVVIPASEREINAPVNTEIKTVHKTSGAVVEGGDLILELDQEYTRLEYERLADELELRRNNVDKLKLQYDRDLRELALRDQIKGLELEEMSAQVKAQKRLKDVGGATDEEVEKAELRLKIATIEKRMLENDLEYRHSVNSAEKKALELEYAIQQKRLSELRRKLDETEVRAPGPGVLTWVNEDVGRTVSAGQPLARIADLARYRVEASASDRNASSVKTGAEVKVRIGDRFLSGQVSQVLPAMENNTVKFYVSLDEAGDPLLRPNLRVEVFLILDRRDNALRLKNGPAFSGGLKQDVFVVDEKGRAVKRSASLGLNNGDFVEITGGLSEGERVIISDVQSFRHLDEFTLKNKR
jgi:HlyD family secretion protein